MDIKIEKKKYIIPKKYWGWAAGGTLVAAVLVWLATGNFASTLKVERRGLSIGNVEKKEFNFCKKWMLSQNKILLITC